MSQERPVLGIDLGTSNSCVAYVDGDQVKVVTDERGRGVIPSIVSLDAQGDFIVGHFAKAQRITNPHATIHSIKRLLGWDFDSPMLQDALQGLSYQVEGDENNNPVCRIGDRLIRPYEVSAQILYKLKEMASSFLGQEIREAVITVPAHFNDRQRKETMKGAELAGLDVLRLINEPTAAALAFGYGYDANATVAVYDFGGGTFDISILEIEDNVFEVLATGGDSYLGGDDINNRVADHVINQFYEQSGINIYNDKMAFQRVLDASEKAKIDLSRVDETVINLPRIAPNIDFSAHLYCKLQREILQELSYDYVQETLEICTATFAEARIDPKSVDDVILVGGSTRMPLVKEMVAEFFGKWPNDSLHPHHVVAVGAAIQSHSLVDADNDILLVDVTPLSLGIESLGGLFSAVIPKNTKVPHRINQVFTTTTDYQEEVRIKVFQGEEQYTEKNHFLGEFVLSGIRQALKREPQIDVSFRLDANGVLNVEARDLDSGLVQSISIQGLMGGEALMDAPGGGPAPASPESSQVMEAGSIGGGARRRDLDKSGVVTLDQAGQSGNTSNSASYTTGGSASGRTGGTGRTGATGGTGRSHSGITGGTGVSHATGGTGVSHATGATGPSQPTTNADGTPTSFESGTTLVGRYELGEPLGAGAFGAVYQARRLEDNLLVAVKLLMAEAVQIDEAAVERFRREGQVMAAMKHPNLVGVYDLGQMPGGELYMVMEFVQGETLHDILKREKRMNAARAVYVIMQALLGLGEAHRHGVLHRDLKPANIMIYNKDGKRDQVKVIDFGVAKMIGKSREQMENLTVAGKVLGTPRYIAPEQLATNAVHRPCSDLYSIGLIFYRLVTGRRPIRGRSIPDILREHVSPNPVVVEGDPYVPPMLFSVMRKATEKNWQERYQTAADFYKDLRTLDFQKLAQAHLPDVVDDPDNPDPTDSTSTSMTDPSMVGHIHGGHIAGMNRK